MMSRKHRNDTYDTVSILFLFGTMATRLLLLLCLWGHAFAKEPPDVDCLVIHLNYVHCSWNNEGIPQTNYTFSGWFHNDPIRECPTYLSENNTSIGCNQPYINLSRFSKFYTKLVHGNQSFPKKEHDLKSRVKLNPPTNVTIKNGSDSNLWLNWNQISSNCVESEVRYRVNSRKWTYIQIDMGLQNYCVNLPSLSSLYEVQVRSKLGDNCGSSLFWSDWSEPVEWGSNNSTDPHKLNISMSVWTPVMSVVAALVLIILVMLLLHHERIRIIFIPVVPKPSPKLHNVEDWFQLPKGLKESLNYNERPCPVREYSQVSQSDSEGCSVFIPVDGSDLSTSCSSSTTTVLSEEENQISV